MDAPLHPEMEKAEACAFLQVEPNWALDAIAQVARTLVEVCAFLLSTGSEHNH